MTACCTVQKSANWHKIHYGTISWRISPAICDIVKRSWPEVTRVGNIPSIPVIIKAVTSAAP